MPLCVGVKTQKLGSMQLMKRVETRKQVACRVSKIANEMTYMDGKLSLNERV